MRTSAQIKSDIAAISKLIKSTRTLFKIDNLPDDRRKTNKFLEKMIVAPAIQNIGREPLFVWHFYSLDKASAAITFNGCTHLLVDLREVRALVALTNALGDGRPEMFCASALRILSEEYLSTGNYDMSYRCLWLAVKEFENRNLIIPQRRFVMTNNIQQKFIISHEIGHVTLGEMLDIDFAKNLNTRIGELIGAQDKNDIDVNGKNYISAVMSAASAGLDTQQLGEIAADTVATEIIDEQMLGPSVLGPLSRKKLAAEIYLCAVAQDMLRVFRDIPNFEGAGDLFVNVERSLFGREIIRHIHLASVLKDRFGWDEQSFENIRRHLEGGAFSINGVIKLLYAVDSLGELPKLYDWTSQRAQSKMESLLSLNRDPNEIYVDTFAVQ